MTTSRRVSRKLLATALEVAFSVRVADKAAGKKLVDDKLLTKANLDAELEKQVISPPLLYFRRYRQSSFSFY